jgi:hypothetical protein
MNRFFLVLLLTANAFGATASWNAVTQDENGDAEAGILQYCLHYGKETGSYDQSVCVSGATLSFEFASDALEANTEYYAAVKAMDYSGNESDFSEEVYFRTGSSAEVVESSGTPSVSAGCNAHTPSGAGGIVLLMLASTLFFFRSRKVFILAGALCSIAAFILFWPSIASAQLGTLVHDGPATPEQISLFIPGTAAQTFGTIEYKPAATSTYIQAHPIYRIRKDYSPEAPADGFAGVITGLLPGTTYNVRVTIGSAVQNLTATTRSLPPAAGTPNRTIAAGSTTAQIQTIFNSLVAGDVVQFANGTYNIDGLVIDRSGAQAQPIYIRGQSRAGVVLKDPTGQVLRLINASDVVIENLTLEGSNVDSQTNSSSGAIHLHDSYNQKRVTIRNISSRGTDTGVIASQPIEQILIYDNTFTGNNLWNSCFLVDPIAGTCGYNIGWNDDGIRVPGFGNSVFNNTMSGFGDSFAVSDYVNYNVGVHFYRNDVRWTTDDAFEADYGHRNMTFYDNRIQNSMTFLSLDPIRGGPLYVFRNIMINTGRGPFKFNSPNSGYFIYNNTIVRTTGVNHSGSYFGWIQYNNGDQRSYTYQNNIFVYRGPGQVLRLASTGHTPVDFTHNAWFPDGTYYWEGTSDSGSSLAALQSSIRATTPLFGASTKRHQNDVLLNDSDPFATDIVTGSDFLTKVTTPYTPFLSSNATASGTGLVIPGITDGYSGVAPNRGAIITGRAIPIYGDRTLTGDSTKPKPPANLRVQ